MGSFNEKDEHIDLYMEVSKPFFVAGQYVEGCIYIDAKQTRQYKNVVIKLLGEESIFWLQEDQIGGYCSNRIQNYDSVFTVYDFGGTVKKGQYKFPFKFLLPNKMSGSLQYSDIEKCYIRYTLRVEMNHPTRSKDNQFYQIYLKIVEHPQMPLAPIRVQETEKVQCLCFKDYGNLMVNFICDKNFASNGDLINFKILIDNSGGSIHVQGGEITLLQRRILISSNSDVRQQQDQVASIGRIGNVNPGQTRNFQLTGRIPINLSNTAIGACVARYFILHFEVEIEECVGNLDIEQHLMIIKNVSNQIQYEKRKPPSGWSPQEYPEVVYSNMKPFLYQPQELMPKKLFSISRGGEGVLEMKNKNEGMKPYFEEENSMEKIKNISKQQGNN